jgi:hypothetical protein
MGSAWRRTLTLGLAIALGALLSAQAPAPDRTVVVTNDSSLHLQAWQAGKTGYEKVWEARPRAVDAATRDARRSDAIPGGRDAAMVAADIDGDGSNELLVMDTYGVTVYGRTPGYVAFPAVGESYGQALAVGDVDGDGKPEVVTLRTVNGARELETWKPGPAGLASAGKQALQARASSSLVVADADNDGQKEIVLAGYGVTVLKRKAGAWETQAEIPNIGVATQVVRVADVDGDGKNELLAAGSSGRLTVYRAAKSGSGSIVYPVAWQSRYLVADGLRASANGPALAITPALAIGGLVAGQPPAIVVGATQYGKIGDKDVQNGGVLRVFGAEEPQDFAARWTSELMAGPTSVAMGDTDGDGVGEIVYNGREVLKRDEAAHAFRRAAALCPTCTDGVVATLGDLREPVGATRIVPIYWKPALQQVSEGQTQSVVLTLLNVWGEAKDVAVTVTSANGRLSVANGVARVSSIPGGGTASLAPIFVTANTGKDVGDLRVEITAAGGYRQVIPARVFVGPPLPTYLGGPAAPLITDALKKARADNRRVLVEWGSNADASSKAFVAHMVRSEAARTVLYEYEVVRPEVNDAAAIPKTYRGPGAASLPYLSVVDAGGKLLAGQSALPFKSPGEGAAAYDGKKLDEFLAKFKPEYVKAEPLLTDALRQAKGENKALFLWFSAPW